MSDHHPCPCCGHPVLDAMPGGANRFSPVEAPRNYQDLGACDEHGRRYGRPPAEDRAPVVPPLTARLRATATATDLLYPER
ncbi:CPCC family cysteine-rich protein [Streptomyces sp. NPDC057496]|uniref:CPCC family cysteine-rich protein n=1 Tax=Streptomyces sp. NPDC057496 TaxID=3346149 RepID=UPI00367E22B1